MSGFRTALAVESLNDSDTTSALRVTTTAGETTASYTIFGQCIEGVKSLSNRTVTLSFWAYCTAAKKLAVTFRQSFGTGGSPSADVNFHPTSHIVDVDTTWVKYEMTVNIPSIAAKTVGTAGDDYLYLLFWTGAGSDFEASPYEITIGNQASVIYITNVQLEVGASATPFEVRPVSLEELLCHRYYWRRSLGQLSANAYADNVGWSWRFGPACEMRTTPTGSSDFSNVTYSFADSMSWIVTYSNAGSGGRLYFQSNYDGAKTAIYARFSSTDYVALSAEL
jgi:hypothetical protein